MADNIPKGLEDLASFLEPVRPEKPSSHIYFLILENVVVYVGKSSRVRIRIKEHRAQKVISFDRALCLPVPSWMALENLESAFIDRLNPAENLRIPKEVDPEIIAVYKKFQTI